MKSIYAIIISPPENEEEYYTVYVPDMDLYTEGKDISDAIYMAKDAIGATGITKEDLGLPIPKGKTLKPKCKETEFVALVDVDFSAYREKEDTRMVRKNCTIPLWLNKKAEAQHINFSAVLQESLKNILEG